MSLKSCPLKSGKGQLKLRNAAALVSGISILSPSLVEFPTSNLESVDCLEVFQHPPEFEVYIYPNEYQSTSPTFYSSTNGSFLKIFLHA